MCRIHPHFVLLMFLTRFTCLSFRSFIVISSFYFFLFSVSDDTAWLLFILTRRSHLYSYITGIYLPVCECVVLCDTIITYRRNNLKTEGTEAHLSHSCIAQYVVRCLCSVHMIANLILLTNLLVSCWSGSFEGRADHETWEKEEEDPLLVWYLISYSCFLIQWTRDEIEKKRP